jgi:hypothetical protein
MLFVKERLVSVESCGIGVKEAKERWRCLPATSAPCREGGTLNWYLYDFRPLSLYASACQ